MSKTVDLEQPVCEFCGEPEASLTALTDDDPGPSTDLDAETPLPASPVKQYVARHKRETGRAARQHSGDDVGASLDDLDGE